MFICPIHFVCPICLYTPRGTCPHTLLCLCVFLEALHVVGVVMGSPLCWDTLPYITPIWGCLPFNYTPTLSHWFPVHWYVSGISVCYVGISLLLKGLGVFPPSVGGLGASALEMSICSFLYLFCSALCLTF